MNYIREAKEFLMNYKDYCIANDNLKDKLNLLKTELEGYKPVIISGTPRGSSSSTDDKLCNLIFERDKIKEYLEVNSAKLTNCESILNNLPEEYRKILILSYVEYRSETEIMMDLHMSERTYYRRKEEAIRCLARQLFGITVSGY